MPACTCAFCSRCVDRTRRPASHRSILYCRTKACAALSTRTLVTHSPPTGALPAQPVAQPAFKLATRELRASANVIHEQSRTSPKAPHHNKRPYDAHCSRQASPRRGPVQPALVQCRPADSVIFSKRASAVKSNPHTAYSSKALNRQGAPPLIRNRTASAGQDLHCGAQKARSPDTVESRAWAVYIFGS